MKKYAVLIGNSQFPDESDKAKLPDLACPVRDVDGLAKVLASERGEFNVLALKNEQSYKILRELQRKLKQTTSDDLFLLYYSGHGKPNKSGLLHLTTLDTVIVELETSAIPMDNIYKILGTGKAKKIVIILDCCYSGAAGQGFKGTVDDRLQQLNNARGTYLVTASTELQVAHENAVEGLSLFTKHLIAGLETGEADKDGDGWVSMNELYDYVHSHVVAENPAQQPTKHVKEERGGLLIMKSGINSNLVSSNKSKMFQELAQLENYQQTLQHHSQKLADGLAHLFTLANKFIISINKSVNEFIVSLNKPINKFIIFLVLYPIVIVLLGVTSYYLYRREPPVVVTQQAVVPTPPPVVVTQQAVVPTPPAVVPTPPAVVPTPPAVVPTPPAVVPTEPIRSPDDIPLPTTHTIEKGESLAIISQKYYFTEECHGLLANFNKLTLREKAKLPVGKEIEIPAKTLQECRNFNKNHPYEVNGIKPPLPSDKAKPDKKQNNKTDEILGS